MLKSLESKTVIGLLILLGTSVVLALLGKLTPEVVEIVKWVGGAYMGVRGVANYAENMAPGKKDE